MTNGFYLVNKEKNMTSFDVVFQMKKNLKQKKIGHTGTLDPDTEGLLVLAVGRATKFIPIVSDEKIKEYVAEITLGIHTDTYDISGEVLELREVDVISEEKIIEVLNSFLGKSTQIPPIYSAKKVDGKRLYEYARNDIEVEIKPQDIEVFSIDFIKRIDNNKFEFKCCVSKGTYVRSLIVDISEKLNTIGTMSSLVRTKTDGFNLNDAKKLDNITKDDFIPLDEYILSKYNKMEVYGKISVMIKNGAQLRIRDNIEYPIVYIDQHTKNIIGIYDIVGETTKPIFMM
ncbi:MAG: tRNA pseudouridine(55) synthase TruB [Mycoplasmatales bacterium]